MMDDFLFRFTDSEWDKISAELGQTLPRRHVDRREDKGSVRNF